MDWLIRHKMAVLGFAVSAAYWPGLLSPAYTPRWVVLLIGLPLVSQLDPRAIPETLRWVLAFVLSMAAIATFWASPDPWSGGLELFYAAILCVAFIAGANLANMTDLMRGLGVGLALSSVLGLCQYLQIWSPLPQGGNVISGLFYNPEILAEFAALILVWALLERSWLIAATAAIPVALCGSRIAIIAVACGLLYAYWPRNVITRVAVVAVGATVLGIMALALGAYKLGTLDHRLVLWVSTIAAWTQYGHGLGWFEASHPAETFAHSDALQVIAEVGVAGFALLAIPYVAFRNNRGSHAERACFVAVCVEIVVSFPLHFPASGFLAAVLSGYLVCDRDWFRVEQHYSGHGDVGADGWHDAVHAGDHGARGRRSGAMAVRQITPQSAAVLSQRDCPHSLAPRMGEG